MLFFSFFLFLIVTCCFFFQLTYLIDWFIVSGQDSKVNIAGTGTVSRNGKTSLNIQVEIDGLGPGAPGVGVGAPGVGEKAIGGR